MIINYADGPGKIEQQVQSHRFQVMKRKKYKIQCLVSAVAESRLQIIRLKLLTLKSTMILCTQETLIFLHLYLFL